MELKKCWGTLKEWRSRIGGEVIGEDKEGGGVGGGGCGGRRD